MSKLSFLISGKTWCFCVFIVTIILGISHFISTQGEFVLRIYFCTIFLFLFIFRRLFSFLSANYSLFRSKVQVYFFLFGVGHIAKTGKTRALLSSSLCYWILCRCFYVFVQRFGLSWSKCATVRELRNFFTVIVWYLS